MSSVTSLNLTLYQDDVTVYRLNKETQLPPDIFTLKWFTISKTLDEVSIILPSQCGFVIGDKMTKAEPGWRVIKIEAVLDFGLVGTLASIVTPLKEEAIPVFVVSTYDTDYILIKSEHVEKAKKAIIKSTGYAFTLSDTSLV
ncbi:uncharacterized protein LOC110863519 isoform X1 [Folsomia candida]|nr:uncharacterized protein LOC110863519 isoform X1 [Folsomia candida]